MTTTIKKAAEKNKVKADPPFCRFCNQQHGIIDLNPTSHDPRPVYACSGCKDYGGPVMVLRKPVAVSITITPYDNWPVMLQKEVNGKRYNAPFGLSMYDQVTTRCNYCGKLDSFYPMALLQIGTKYNYPCHCGNRNHGTWIDWIKLKFGDFSYLWHQRNETFKIGGSQ